MLHGRPEKDWAQSAVFYQIYPMGFCGAPFENDGVAVNRIQKVKEWIPHLEKLGVGAIYFSPVFESDTHGYDTRDYKKIDCRLGTNQDFKEVCEALHRAGIRVMILSNNRSPARVERFCRDLGIDYVDHAGKPSPRGYRQAMEKAGVTPGETAMLGDKLLTDVLGANRSGAWAVMVEPAGGPRGAWNHVLHGLQRPFKALCRSRKEAKA